MVGAHGVLVDSLQLVAGRNGWEGTESSNRFGFANGTKSGFRLDRGSCGEVTVTHDDRRVQCLI